MVYTNQYDAFLSVFSYMPRLVYVREIDNTSCNQVSGGFPSHEGFLTWGIFSSLFLPSSRMEWGSLLSCNF